MDYAVAVGFGHILQECQGVTEPGLGGQAMSPPKYSVAATMP